MHEFREKVKRRVMNETTPVPRIYDEEYARMMLSIAAIAILPSEREMNKILILCIVFIQQVSLMLFR